MAVLFPPPKFSSLTTAGTLLSGGLLYTYEAGTSTPLATYTDAGGLTANTNPVVLDARGEANVWYDGSKLYKLVLKTSAEVTIWTVDNVGGVSTGDISYTSAGVGAVSRALSSIIGDRISVLAFIPTALHAGIADASNSTALETYIQAAITYAKSVGKAVFFPGGTYLISNRITNLTNDNLGSNPHNGIELIGELKTKIKASATFSATAAMLDLDGNILDFTTTANAKIQQFNRIENIEFDGSSRAVRGLRLRANSYCTFKNLYMHDFLGTGADAVIFVHSTADQGQDDTDTTSGCIFENVRIHQSTGYGFFGASNRTGALEFRNCDIRYCSYDGMRISFASLLLANCTFAGNGSNASATVGGLTVVTSNTKSINRGGVAIGCHWENNYNHEINIDQCEGFLVLGGTAAPYVSTAATQDVMRFGVESTSGLVNCIEVRGFRIQNYAAGAHTISGMQVGLAATNIDFNNITFYTGTALDWNTQAEQYVVHAAAKGIRKDGICISQRDTRPEFLLTSITDAATIPNVTGDGTEYSTATLATVGGTLVERKNHGPTTNSFAITASIAGTALTVTAVTGTPIYPGQTIVDIGGGIGASVAPPDVLPNTYITAFVGGSGGTGTYEVNRSQTVASRGMYCIVSSPVVNGTFTAPNSGSYRFEVAWPCTGFGGAETDIEVAFVVNGTTRWIAHKERPTAALNAAAINTYVGARDIPLAANDTVVGTIKISGGTQIVDLYRDIPAPGLFRFSGRAV